MLDLKVHHYEKIPNSQESRMTRVNPYLRLARKDEPPVFVQGGKVYSEGGAPLEHPPTWFAEDMGKLTAQARAEVGWQGLPPAPAAVVAKPVVEWTCPAEGCGQTMPAKNKGFHVARHRREERSNGDG